LVFPTGEGIRFPVYDGIRILVDDPAIPSNWRTTPRKTR
jgi:hypothetical protein